MTDFSNQIALIKRKVSTLLSDNQSLKNDRTESNATIETLKSELAAKASKVAYLENELLILQSENKKLKVVDCPVTVVAKPTVSEKEINKMIKEIDECLALLDI